MARDRRRATHIAGPSTAGVQGQSNATNGNGLFGVALSGPLAKGAWGRSANGFGVYGEATAATGTNYGVRGVTPSTSGIGVQGLATATSGGTFGVYGQVASPAGRGVKGVSTATNGIGVFGVANAGGNATGVWGRSVDGRGVYGEATGGYGVYRARCRDAAIPHPARIVIPTRSPMTSPVTLSITSAL